MIVADVADALGIPWGEKVIGVVNGEGSDRVAGDLMMFDFGNTTGLAPNAKQGTDSSFYSVVLDADGSVSPGAGGNWHSHGLVCVLKEDIPDGGRGQAYLWGHNVRARILAAYGLGNNLQMPATSGRGFEMGAGGGKTFGFLHTATTGAGFYRVTFNGIYTLGVN